MIIFHATVKPNGNRETFEIRMNDEKENSFFLDRPLPEEEAKPVGYSRLIHDYDLKVPLPHQFSFISRRHQRYETPLWAAFTPRHQPEESIPGHLTFALRYEGIDLAILKALFEKINSEIIARWIRSEPTGSYSRRVWFLYEWLTAKVLDEPDVLSGNYVDVVTQKFQYGTIKPIPSRRHRVNNNFPGTKDFCPLIRRTQKLEKLIERCDDSLEKLKKKTRNARQNNQASIRLGLADAYASYALDRIDPQADSAQGWLTCLKQTPKPPLSLQELCRIQSIIISDERFVPLGLRKVDTFQGFFDPVMQAPVPASIPARSKDLPSLMEGWLNTWALVKEQGMDPILGVASLAFGFAFISPFSDGNGRIQRYIIHYALEQLNFSPPGLLFPISVVLFDRFEDYQEVLNAFWQTRLNLVSWRLTTHGAIQVTNETKDLYAFFDATAQAEFLYDCVAEVIEVVLSDEFVYINQNDRLKEILEKKFDMPHSTLDSFIRILHQNQGTLSKQDLEKELQGLSDQECEEVEAIYRQIFINEAVSPQ